MNLRLKIWSSSLSPPTPPPVDAPAPIFQEKKGKGKKMKAKKIELSPTSVEALSALLVSVTAVTQE